MARRSSPADRFLAARDALLERSRRLEPVPAGDIQTALAEAIGAARAAAAAEGRDLSPELRAVLNRQGVHRMSIAGLPVDQIADELGLSYGHVVKLRALLGVSRRR